VTSATSISGTIAGTATGNVNFSDVPNSPLNGPVTALSGVQWTGEFEGAADPIIWNINFLSAGNNNSVSFRGFGTNRDGTTCDMSGTFNQEGGNAANLNVFDISITSLNGGCPLGATVTGVGFESNSDYFNLNGNAAGTYFYAVPSNGASVLEIFHQ
jgi:hypothetical protein